MKLMIASDLHGSLFYCNKMAEAYQKEQAERLILLGDLLYHGPRNDLPKDYNPKGVIPILNGMKKELLCVRGNCDCDVDQMVLEFPIMADYAMILLDGITVFATHGHVHNKSNPPPLKQGDILLHGHTHIPAMEDLGGIFYLNPGSLSIPKEGSRNSYLIYQDGIFRLKDLEQNELAVFQYKA